MSYQVRYKNPWWPCWRKLSGVKGDGFLSGMRSFYLESGALLLIPVQGVIFEFGPERITEIRLQSGQVRQPLTPYPVQAGRLKWQVVEESASPTPAGHVVLLLADDRRIELPPTLVVKFGAERAKVIAQRLEQESGGQARVNP